MYRRTLQIQLVTALSYAQPVECGAKLRLWGQIITGGAIECLLDSAQALRYH